MNIKSMSHCTRNENDFEEVQLVYEKTTLDAILRREGKMIRVEKRGKKWYYFGTEDYVSAKDEKAVMECIAIIKYGNQSLDKLLEKFKG